MKIALIYFGQPRFINNAFCFESQKNSIMSQGECDIFAHLWEPTDKGYDFSTWSGLTNVESSNNDIEVFKEKWNPKAILTEKNMQFASESLYDKFQSILPGDDEKLYNFNICLSQLYSLEKAIELYENYVKESNEKYDYVVFLRTDLCIWEFPDLNYLEKDIFYFSSFFSFDHFADLCFITDPKYVDGLKAFSFVTNEEISFENELHFGNAESIKKASFLRKHSIDKLRQIPLPVRVVRGATCVGLKW